MTTWKEVGAVFFTSCCDSIFCPDCWNKMLEALEEK